MSLSALVFAGAPLTAPATEVMVYAGHIREK